MKCLLQVLHQHFQCCQRVRGCTPNSKRSQLRQPMAMQCRIGHAGIGESQSAERLSYVGDVAPPTRIRVDRRANKTIPCLLNICS